MNHLLVPRICINDVENIRRKDGEPVLEFSPPKKSLGLSLKRMFGGFKPIGFL